jgi:CDP-diacylglycerol--glycerol-3-phosphate 3-phosphatidyltransferase
MSEPGAAGQRSALLTVPNLVTLSRLFMVPPLLWLAWSGRANAFVILLTVSALTARWLSQSSEFGARLDSWADFATYTTLPQCAYWLRPEVVRDEAPYFWLMVASFLTPKAYGFVKFRKLTSYHTRGTHLIAYVVWIATLLMFAGISTWPFRLAAFFIVWPKLEEIAITTVLPFPVTMVNSLGRALEIRRQALAAPPLPQ